MTDELQDLYQEVILDHSRSPRNYGPLPFATHAAEGDNPLCGDHCRVQLKTEGERILQVRFEGSGCAISKAAASVMTQAVAGQTRQEVERLFDQFQKIVTTGGADGEANGRLAAFAGVHQFPARVKCALLSWHALHAALHGDTAPVTTEPPARPVPPESPEHPSRGTPR